MDKSDGRGLGGKAGERGQREFDLTTSEGRLAHWRQRAVAEAMRQLSTEAATRLVEAYQRGEAWARERMVEYGEQAKRRAQGERINSGVDIG